MKTSVQIPDEIYRQTKVDCLIMATALLKNHKIASRNVSHYPEKALILKIPAVI